jgi:hypothetical protein
MTKVFLRLGRLGRGEAHLVRAPRPRVQGQGETLEEAIDDLLTALGELEERAARLRACAERARR